MKLAAALALASLVGWGCAAPGPAHVKPQVPMRSAPFEYTGVHFLVVPVRVNDAIDARFILDTGIGVNLISMSLCKQIGCRIDGEASGRRMSGQEVTFPTTRVPALTFAGHREQGTLAGVFDFEERNFGVDPSISGFLSLDFFRRLPFTIDYRSRTVTLDDEATLRERRRRGRVTPIRLDEEGPAIDVFTEMALPHGLAASIEIDTGSPALTLHERFIDRLGIAKAAPHLREKAGTDETGHAYVRHFAAEPVPIGLAVAPPDERIPVKAMFQAIIYDGLIGDAFLRHFDVTFDLPRREMIFARTPEP
jgi:hypothetical protein